MRSRGGGGPDPPGTLWSSEPWLRRVGLHGTHNHEPFELTHTELDVDIDERRGEQTGGFPCSVRITHVTAVSHHTADFWYPISDLGAIKSFAASVDGSQIVGGLHEAVDEQRTRPHQRGSAMNPKSLYYLHATGADAVNEALTDLRRGGSVKVEISFLSQLIPVEVKKGAAAKSFMLPVCSCFPRGVDVAGMRVHMHEYIRDIYPALPEAQHAVRWRRDGHNTANVRMTGSPAISPASDLFVLNIDCGPKVVHSWDALSAVVLIVFVAAVVLMHRWSAREDDHRVFDSFDGL